MERKPSRTCVGDRHGRRPGKRRTPVGPGGIFSLGAPANLELLAKGARFVDVAAEEVAITFRTDSIDAHVERISSLASKLATVLPAASPPFSALCVTDNGLAIPGQALLLFGRR